MAQEEKGKTRGTSFVSFILDRMEKDSRYGALLRRADNPATEHHAWEVLASWCDLENRSELRSFATIAAALARSKSGKDGTFGVGRAIGNCYSEGSQAEAAKMRMRRLLAARNSGEACVVLRATLQLIASKGVPLNYGELLDQLLYFGDKVRTRWATDFYGKRGEDVRINV